MKKKDPLKRILTMSFYTFSILAIQMIFASVLMASEEARGQDPSNEKKKLAEVELTIPETHLKLSKAFDLLNRKTGFSFSYVNSNVPLQQKVMLSSNHHNLKDILLDISQQTNLAFKRINSRIIAYPYKTREDHEIKEVFTEEPKKVSGIVKDESLNEGIPGVNVILKNTNIGTVTDVEGKYTLEVMGEDPVLVFSSVGYVTQEVEVGEQSVIDIVLEQDITALGEIVVIGYGTEKKMNLTGAVATVKNEELVQVPVASTTQALAGRLPGLISKQSEGKPGSTPSLSIRGFGNPLVIVDGVQQENYYNIDPNEIESFTVLKDASAAVYGARAGNGVILITTKRGVSGKPVISFNANTSVQAPTIFPEFVDSWEYAIIQNEASEFAGQSPVYTEEDIQKFRAGTDPDYPNTDQYREVIKKWSPMQSYNLNVSGGGENVNYFLSLGHLFQDGIYRSDGVNMNRYNVRSNVDIKVANNFSVGLDLATRNTYIDDVPFSSQAIFQTIGTTTNRFPAAYPDPTKTPYVGRSSHSPKIKINPDLSGYDNTDRQYLTGALTLKYEIPFFQGLNIKVRGNYVGDKRYNKNWTKPFSTYYYDRQNDIYTVAATGGKYSLTENNTQAQDLTFQGFLEYENTFANHEIKALLVSEVIDSKSNWFNAYKDGFISGAVDQMFAGSSENMSTNGSAFEESRVSYVGRLNYIFQSKYLLEGTLRYDGSSRFAEDQRWALFPSISAAWRISEEPFINRLTFIDYLKLRLSYSHTGYDLNAGAYQYLPTYSFNTQYVFGSTPYKTIRNNGLANPFISWEDIYTYNAGLEADFWNGLLGVEFDVFYRLREGILGTRTSTLPTTFGATLPQENINSIDNRGLELVLNHRNNKGAFNYLVSTNLSWTRAKFVDYAEQEYEDPDEERLYKRTGQWENRIFGYKTAGFFQTQEEIDSSPIDYDQKENSTLQPGMIKYVDINDDKVIDWRDQVEIGRGGLPEIMFGLNFQCEYKGFDLSMLWQGASHFNIEFSQNMRTLSINNVWNSYKFLYDGRWTPENPDADFPRTTNGHNSHNYKTSDLWLKPADYIRLKSIALGYSLPESLINRISIDKVRVYVAGYNTLTLSRVGKFPFDPEGIGNSWTYPLYKSFSLGLNIVL